MADTTFADLEARGWCSAEVASPYVRFFEHLTAQCVPRMLASCDVVGDSTSSSLTRVLDVATGHGVVAIAAAAKGGQVTAVDFSEPFLDMAKQSAQSKGLNNIKFVQADAQKLPFDDASFDVVLCNFGVLHLGEPDAFFAEASRCLAPGGKLAFTVWVAPPKTAPFEITLRSVRECGNADVPLPQGPSFFKYADAASVASAMEAVGLEPTVLAEEVPQTMQLDRAEDLFELFATGTVRTRALLRAQTDDARRAIAARMAEEVRTAGLNLPCPACLSVAVKKS